MKLFYLILLHLLFETSDAENVNVTKTAEHFHKKRNVDFIDLIREELEKKAWSGNAECYNHTMAFLESAQNSTLAGIWLWDTMQLPTGVLYGSRYQLGNYDECLKAPWDSNPRLRTQYCLADVQLVKSKPYKGQKFDSDSPARRYISTSTAFARDLTKLTWGVCLPAACDPGSVANFTRVLLDKSPLGRALRDPRVTTYSCTVSAKQYITGTHIFFMLVIILLAATVMSTVVVQDATSKSYATDVMRAFCLKKNLNSLVKESEDDIKVIHFLRVMFAASTLMAHCVMMKNSMAVNNAMDLEKDTILFYFAHVDVLITGFFFMSGLLFARSLLSKDQNILFVILKRYFRLIGPFAVMVAFFGTAWREAGDGPLWVREAAREQAYCRDNWWLSLLMLNNYIHADRLCHFVSWYIPADFHLTLVCAVLYLVYRRRPTLAKTLFCLLGVASLVVPAVTSYHYQLQGILISDVDSIIQYYTSKYFVEFYSKSHTHASGYLVGVLGAYILTVGKPKTSEPKVQNKKRSTILFLFLLVNFYIPIWMGALFWNKTFGECNVTAAAIFEGTNRIYFAIILCCSVLCYHYGITSAFRKLFYWSVWAPFSKLCYGLYLIHPAILLRNIYSARAPASYDVFTLVTLGLLTLITTCTDSLGAISLAFLLSLLMYLLVEAPLSNLSNLMLSPRKKEVS